MANYATLKAGIVAAIKENGNNEITGNLLQQQLLAMVNSLGIGYQYADIATPDTNPGTPDQNVFYLASTAGTYANFGGLVLADGEIAILKYNGAWSKDSTGAATQESVNQLGQKVYITNGDFDYNYFRADGKQIQADGTIINYGGRGYFEVELGAGATSIIVSGCNKIYYAWYNGETFLERNNSESVIATATKVCVGYEISSISGKIKVKQNGVVSLESVNGNLSYKTDKLIYPLFVSVELTSKIYEQVKSAVAELYISDYNPVRYDYILQVVRKGQNVSGTIYTDFRVAALNKGTTTLAKTYRMDNHSESGDYDFGDGVQLLSLNSGEGYALIDWNKITTGTGYGQVLRDYLLVDKIGNIDCSPTIKAEICSKNIVISAINNIKLIDTGAEKDGSTAIIPAASAQKPGLMSQQDKAKLDNIVNPGTINITSSGITKNAYDYGFIPTNSASDNVSALRDAVSGGGTIYIDLPGTYYVNDSIQLPSNTTLVFGAGVFISMQASKRFLINEGAYTKSYNENISIYGLSLITNGYNFNDDIPGLRGYLAFFYIKNLTIDGFRLFDGAQHTFVIHICTFENISLTNIRIEGWKDAIHLGRGSKFVIRDCIFMTYDDPIALNAYDFPSANPEYGWIEDGVIENVFDLADPIRGTTGYFSRILAGSWLDWESGNSYQINGDMCVSDGRMYITTGQVSTEQIVSTYQPNHSSGIVTYPDGLTWRMVQDSGVVYSCGCRRIHFKDIFLQKQRGTAFQYEMSNGAYSRCFYPGSTPPSQDDIIFENIFFEAQINNLINCVTPVNVIKLVNSVLNNSKISLGVGVSGMTCPNTHIIMSGTTFKGNGSQNIASASGRTADIKILGSVIDSDNFTPSVTGVTVISNDIGL